MSAAGWADAAGLSLAVRSAGVCFLAVAKLALARALLRTACISASAVDPAAGTAAVALPPALLPFTGFAADTPATYKSAW